MLIEKKSSSLVTLCILAFIAVTLILQDHPQNYSSGEGGYSEYCKTGLPETFWRRTVCDPINFYILWLAAFTAILAVSTIDLWWVTWGASVSQARDMRESLDIAEGTLVAAQRPWIQVKKITLTGPLVFGHTPDDREGFVGFAFLIKNVGNSPAVRIELNVKLTISNTRNLLSEQKAFADALRTSRENARARLGALQPEITLFPGEERLVRVGAWMQEEPLRELRGWAATHPGAIALPAVVGSIYYEFTFSEGLHQTGIIFGLRKATPYPSAHPLPTYASIPSGSLITNQAGAVHLEGTIPRADLVLAEDFVGMGPVD